ncbi:MAG: T9SS C-terminal target domain-containing protein [Ignavibacteriae bacterium]|nr:MAG: T9SS C-terminal target domain-containing protein [Ignavibacteriota bacterium]
MRKNLPFTLFLLFALHTISFSQNFTFVRTDPNPKYGPANEQISVFATLTNNTNNNITISIKLTNAQKPAGWDAIGMCTWLGCHGPGDSIFNESCPPGANDFDVYFTPNNIPGSASCIVTMTYQGQSISQDFGVVANPIGVKQISSVLKDFSLSQNYPNPFNPSSKINFSIPKRDFVELKVYDMLGKEVMVLANGYMSAGEYEVQFDASGLSSGMYFYRMQSGDYISVKKMTFIK